MTDATSIDATFTDAITDMTPFMERHRRRSRWSFILVLSASLAVSAASLTYGALAAEAPGALFADLWAPMAFFPLFLVVFRIIITRFTRRLEPPGGRYLMSADDARNTTRVANAGFIFLAGTGIMIVGQQAFWAIAELDLLESLTKSDWIARVSLLAGGALLVYFGNVLPKGPVLRTPGQLSAAEQMKANRLTGWFYVIFGALFGLAALFLPSSLLALAVAAISIAVFIACGVGVVVYYKAVKSRKVS